MCDTRHNICKYRFVYVNIDMRRKFRSENLLKNGKKNWWNLPCGELLLSFIVSMKERWWRLFSPKPRVRIKDSNNSPHGKFHWFLFPFSSKTSPHMFFIFTYAMSRVTHSEPGLPMIHRTVYLLLWSSFPVSLPFFFYCHKFQRPSNCRRKKFSKIQS